MAGNNYIHWYDNYYDRLAKLSDQEVGRLVRALMVYHRTGETQELAGRESVAYDFIVADIDEADEAYAKKCETNKKNRARPSTTVNDRERTSTKTDGRKDAPSPLIPPCPSPSASPPHPPITNPSHNPPIIPPSPKIPSSPSAREARPFATTIPTDPRISIVFTAYSERIGSASPMTERIRDQLLVFLDAMGPECCIRAMDETVEAGKISWKYVKAILEKKRGQGVRSIADWEKAEEAYSGKKRAANRAIDFQPDDERIRRSGEQLDKFFDEMEAKKKEGGQA